MTPPGSGLIWLALRIQQLLRTWHSGPASGDGYIWKRPRSSAAYVVRQRTYTFLDGPGMGDEIKAYRCESCLSLQTEEPYWLQDEYGPLRDRRPESRHLCRRAIITLSIRGRFPL